MTTFKTFTNSEIFTALNKARKAIRERGTKIDKGRLNRAFALLQAGTVRPYRTTLESCNCEDAHKGYVCKHRAEFTLAYRILIGRGISPSVAKTLVNAKVWAKNG